jgi:hypothetical protein
MKPLQSAQTSFQKLPNGQLVLTIAHDVVRGVSPRMIAWWFQNLDGFMEFEGQTYSRYFVWHPIDHLHWEIVQRGPGGSTGRGAFFRIVEAFGANPKHSIDSVERVEKCDEEGLTLVKCIFGMEVFRLEHTFAETPFGTQYDSRMVVGSSLPVLGGVFNRLIRPLVFSDKSAQLWLKHNIEEVGNFEVFLPELYFTHVPKEPGKRKPEPLPAESV